MSRDALAWIDEALEQWRGAGLLRELRTRQGAQRPIRCVLDGREYVNFSSNDYLGLAAELGPRISSALLDREGWGSGASPLVTGRSEPHAILESALAEFEGCEAALLFPSGFAANAGTIPTLVGPGDVILSDAKNHASIIDGCRLSGAEIRVYRHADLDSVREQSRDLGHARRVLLVTDSLFSMDGDFAPLTDLAELARTRRWMLMVDEAHATGVWGETGRGVAELLGAEEGVSVRVGTLSKALGSVGGFVAGSKSLITWLANRARSYVFSTATPAATATAALTALDIVRQEPERRRRLEQLAAGLRQHLESAGWTVGQGLSQIIPVYLGDPSTTMRHADRLRQEGLLVPGIRPPSVPQGESLLRISLTTAHEPEMLDHLVQVLGAPAASGS